MQSGQLNTDLTEVLRIGKKRVHIYVGAFQGYVRIYNGELKRLDRHTEVSWWKTTSEHTNWTDIYIDEFRLVFDED